jgi:hypothetical protein
VPAHIGAEPAKRGRKTQKENEAKRIKCTVTDFAVTEFRATESHRNQRRGDKMQISCGDLSAGA